MGIFLAGDHWPIYDEDGVVIGLMCGHLAVAPPPDRAVWEGWKRTGHGTDYLLRLCTGCYRDERRAKHQRRHRR